MLPLSLLMAPSLKLLRLPSSLRTQCPLSSMGHLLSWVLANQVTQVLPKQLQRQMPWVAHQVLLYVRQVSYPVDLLPQILTSLKFAMAHTITSATLATHCVQQDGPCNRVTAYDDHCACADVTATAEVSTAMHRIVAGATTSADEEVPTADTADQAAAQEAATTAESLGGSPDPDAQPGMGKKSKSGSAS